MRVVIRAAVLGLAFSTDAASQEILWERVGVANEHMLANQVIVLGDVNADGFEDLLAVVRTFKWVGCGLDQEDQLWILSGRDGRTLSIRSEWGYNRPYYIIAAVGDINGDGVPDYAASVLDIDNSPPFELNFVEVRSGRDHSLIWQVISGERNDGFGARMVGSLDIDGDGRRDLVVGAPYWQLPPPGPRVGRVYAYDNRGRFLYRVDGNEQLALGRFGHSEQGMGVVGDINGDRCDDYVLGGVDFVAGLGAAIVLSGRDGSVLRIGRSSDWREVIGWTTAGVGDIDDDGVHDFAGGSYPSPGGRVEVFSGRTGLSIRAWQGNPHGLSLRSGVDIDRDGVPDIVTSSARSGYGTIVALSGRDGSTIHEVVEPVPGSGLGRFLAVAGPQPGSPFPVFAVVEHDYSFYMTRCGFSLPLGRVRVFRGTPAGASVYGTACRGSLPTIPRIGMRQLGSTGVRLHLHDAEPGGSAVLLLGLSRTQLGNGTALPVRLDALGFPGCSLHTSVDLFLSVPVGAGGLARGYAFVDLMLPLATPGNETFALHGQWLAVGSAASAPGALTEPMRWLH